MDISVSFGWEGDTGRGITCDGSRCVRLGLGKGSGVEEGSEPVVVRVRARSLQEISKI